MSRYLRMGGKVLRYKLTEVDGEVVATVDGEMPDDGLQSSDGRSIREALEAWRELSDRADLEMLGLVELPTPAKRSIL